MASLRDKSGEAAARAAAIIKLRITQVAGQVLISFWSRKAPVTTPARTFKTAPADNLQQHMNLVMPLRDRTAVGRARAAKAVGTTIDETFTGLSNVGTVHFARFDIIAGNLCMFSVYDGDFTNYIRDFIAVFGTVFNALMDVIEDPPPTPCELHPQAFVDWINDHDAFQMPADVSSLFPGEGDIANISRDVVLLLDQNPNVQLGRFSNYPGVSAAQIRRSAGMGW
jgi:hypothetical protein